MANLKKEVMNLISRFDAAQEAFSTNSVDVKELRKKHKKELKKVNAEARAARIEVEALKAELAILRASIPAKKVSAKRSPGRPKKSATATAKPAVKRGPGRPKKTATEVAKPVAKKGPGRPKKSTTAAAAAKRSAGRPKKATTAAKPAAGAVKKSPGRPRKTPAVPVSALVAIVGVGPAMAAKFEEAGVKTPAALSKLSNVKMAAILAKCGPRYRNADSTKMQAYRDAATAAK